MNRRNWLKLACCAVAVAAVEVCGLKPVAIEKRIVMNPAWAIARYEETFIFHPKVMKMLGDVNAKPCENRYNLLPDGRFQMIPRYIEEYT